MIEPCVIAIFARAPVAGQTKTRLIPRLGADGAARLHGQMIRHCLEQAREAAVGPLEIWGVDISHPFLRNCAAQFGAELRQQPDGDLGDRMLACFEAHAGRSCLLAGTDAPAIMADDFRACAAALAGEANDAVFLPAEDGGYGLVGMKRPLREVFREIGWGGSNVMSATRERLRSIGARWAEPRTIWDVDHPADVDRLEVSGLIGQFSFATPKD